jgi:hypothetical protein
MKKPIILTMSLLLLANSARADFFRIVSDPVNQKCYLGPAGFNDHAAIIVESSPGSTGARFKIHVPSGSGIFSVSSPYATTGDFTDLTINYGTCLAGQGPWVIATFVSTLVAGIAEIWPAEGQSSILTTDCAFQVQAGGASWWSFIGDPVDPGLADCGIPLSTESSTWGAVKALYR